MYRTLVVEDEAQEARHLTDLLTRYGKQHGVEFKVTWHSSAMEMLSDKGHYDLCLLDIEMPGINGMEAAGLLRTYDETIPIIFVTNLAKYAVKGYEVGALGFIVKPVSYGGLSLSLDRALRAIGANAGRSVAVPTEDGVRVVPLRSIIYVEVTKHRLTYHIENEEPLEARGSLVQLEEELAEAPVVRVSKSCLANMDKISLVRNAEVQMTNGDLLRISRTHKKEVVDKVRLPGRPPMSVARALAGLLSARWAVQIVVTLTIPVFMLAHRLPHRPDTKLRGAVAILALFVLCTAPVATGAVRGLGITESSAVFTVLLAIYALLIMWVYDTGPWPALFCATAGYTLQNLASGLEVLCAILASHRSSGELPEPWSNILGFGIPLVVYVVGYLSFVRQIDRNGLAGVGDKSMLAMFLVVVLVIINFDILIKSLSWGSVKYTSLILLRMVHSVLCAFVLFAEYEILYARRMSDEKAETERLLAERQRQYRLSKENIDAINIKCHDIRHQIRHFADKGDVVDREALRDIAREVNVYDSVVETGNEALDTILTEKSLACSQENITLSCIADGAALGFLAPSDIYSFFGNALDNAIEATRPIEDPERRNISLNVARRGAMVAVSVENFYATEPQFDGDLPRSTKGDDANHGFGVRSMRGTVERYGGTLHVGTNDGVFYLNALLPAK